jgi:putative membrane-bound dehydrogenase-like protein
MRLNRIVSSLVLCTVLVVPAGACLSDDPDYSVAWHILSVPGTWDEHVGGDLDAYDGFAWYRCLVTLPGGWKTREVKLRIENIDDAYEAYVNGVKVGAGGAFPPQYAPSAAETVEHLIPADALKTGNNLVAIRIFDHDSRGGFKGAAPVVTSGEQGINLNGLWEFRTGDDVEWAKGPIAVTNTGIYWRTMETAAAIELARAETRALPPAEAARAFSVPEDLEIVEVLAEPVVKQPLYMTWDERGRLWVMQYIQYPYPAGLTMVSKDEFWRSVYDRLPEPPPKHFPGADKITIHEDTDGDGVLDTHKTFVEGLSIATSFAKGRGGVWVLNPPYLLFYPDRDNDDVPDADPQVHLQGFGFEDTHSVANSLRWGPDGWLYACQGSTVSGNIFRPGIDKPEQAVHSMGQLIWRYHPETRQYEIFAEGGGNAFGLEIDSKGRVYSGHNGGDTRGFHYVQGGYYQKGFSKHGPLSNPYSFGYFPWMKHHAVPRFTHNFVIYEGGVAIGGTSRSPNETSGAADLEVRPTVATHALPEQYSGRLFGVEPLQGQVVQSEVVPDTSTFATKDIDRVIKSSDKWFRPVDIKVGPDGGVYVADMYEPQISHREHFSGQIDKTNGRVWRLQARGERPGGNARERNEFRSTLDLGEIPTRELIGVLRNANKWYRQQALVIFGDRRDASVVPQLKEYVRGETGQFALECLWALNLSGGFDEDFAREALDHEDPFVRLWTVRLLCDDRQVSDPIGVQLANRAANEPYVQVRSQLASSAKRLPARQGLPIVRNLLARGEDLDDVHIPLLLWWAIESKAASDSDAVVALLQDRAVWELPLVQKHLLSRLMRRYAAAGTRKDLLVCARLLQLAPGKDDSAELMKGFEEAFAGRSLAELPDELVAAIDKSGSASLVLQVRSAKLEAVEDALRVVADSKAEPKQRRSLVQVFGEVDLPQTVDALLALATGETDDALRMAALTSLQRYKEPRIGAAVVGGYTALSADAKAAAQTLLASRAEWSRQLVQAVEAGRIDAATLPRDTVRLMTFHRDAALADLVRKHWPDLAAISSEQMQADLARLGEVLKSGNGDPYPGKRLYKQSCGKCHLLFGDGGRIGPDLTSFKRDDNLRILLNVVNPSAEIREGFESFLVLTGDGRALNGFLYDQDPQVVVLRGADGQNVTIPRDNIEEMIQQKQSLMPEGLLKDLTDQQVRDLFAFLRTSQPLND